MRVAHLGAYESNVGDTVAMFNIRRDLSKYRTEIEWQDVNIIDFHDKKNEINYCLDRFSEINKTCQMLLIGGGGLIEGGHYNDYYTKWKLPFNKAILNAIKIPIVCHSLGFNYFRGHDTISSTGLRNLKLLIEKSTLFSVRDDGSYDIAKSLNLKVLETPDPGLIWTNCKSISDITTGGLQVAWNSSDLTNIHRFVCRDNIEKLVNIANKFNLIGVPHTRKDFNFPFNNWMIDKSANHQQLMQMINSQYNDISYMVSMRGHGQMISMGLGIPGIYLSTQDKINNFAIKAGMEDYLVDMQDDDWSEKLCNCINKMISCKKYIDQWYVKRQLKINKVLPDYEQFNKRISKIS